MYLQVHRSYLVDMSYRGRGGLSCMLQCIFYRLLCLIYSELAWIYKKYTRKPAPSSYVLSSFTINPYYKQIVTARIGMDQNNVFAWFCGLETSLEPAVDEYCVWDACCWNQLPHQCIHVFIMIMFHFSEKSLYNRFCIPAPVILLVCAVTSWCNPADLWCQELSVQCGQGSNPATNSSVTARVEVLIS